jgi:hypothetical protein
MRSTHCGGQQRCSTRTFTVRFSLLTRFIRVIFLSLHGYYVQTRAETVALHGFRPVEFAATARGTRAENQVNSLFHG